MIVDPWKRPYLAAVDDAALRQALHALARQRSLPVTALTVVAAFTACGTGVAMAAASPLLAAAAVMPIAVGMLLAWYLAHDCAHLSALRGRRANHALGELLSALNGTHYFRFADYARDHLRHHAERVDLVGVPVSALLGRLPAPLSRAVVALEAIYLPALHLLIKLNAAVEVWRDDGAGARARLLVACAGSGLAWSGMAWLGGAVLLAWLAASVLRIHVVRFVDAFQHSYEQVDPARPPHRHGRDYEQHHTFSFPVARRWTALNLLILNFGHHNAHHALPGCPWFNLARVERLIRSASPGAGGDGPSFRETGLAALLRQYHRHRQYRLTSGDEGVAYDRALRFSLAGFTGAFTDNLLG